VSNIIDFRAESQEQAWGEVMPEEAMLAIEAEIAREPELVAQDAAEDWQ
jgi:hypothetical protein